MYATPPSPLILCSSYFLFLDTYCKKVNSKLNGMVSVMCLVSGKLIQNKGDNTSRICKISARFLGLILIHIG